jgi:23S rRNA (cytidine2498-2'-O)-methyltransferase
MQGTPAVLFSAAEAFLRHAEQELRALLPEGARIRRLGPDLGVIEGEPPAIRDLAARCCSEPLVFVRHLAEVAELAPVEDQDAIAAAALRVARLAGPGELALQAFASGVQGRHPESLRVRVAAELEAAGTRVLRSGAPRVVTLCLSADAARIACNPAADGLVDWPGGRVRLARRPDRISRSELKLEELLQIFPLALPGGAALDLGASPGGWTRVLRERGHQVWAVDPAALAPAVAADPGVQHVRATAGAFLRETAAVFDLVVNDMRIAPELSCELMLDAAKRLREGATAIATLKLSRRDSPARVRDALQILHSSYELAFARQLFHNADEVTVVAYRR